MKAFLLAAGLGTRLRPLTNDVPKCLIPIHERALIDWWYDAMQRAAVSEVLINLHHLPEKVVAHIGRLDTDIKTTFFWEETLLGSAGTLKANAGFVKGEENFFIIYGDNLTSLSLSAFKKFHDSQPHDVSMALFHSTRPENCGIAALDEKNTIIDFIEKPEQPKSDLANAGIYIATPAVIEEIPADKLPCDIGFDLLPLFVNRMSGWTINDYLVDIGTHENLENARRDWPGVIKSLFSN